jgi:hypothetical protein
MKIAINKIISVAFTGLSLAALTSSLADTGRAQNQAAAGAPFIVKDTDNDSPGTNNVTRIVTLKAEIGGTPPFTLQWKVDRGSGFESIPGATNATYRIGNAQISDSGLYSLFATNDFGHISTTPAPLIVTEAED